MPNQNQSVESVKHNEGCYNCGNEEDYPGADDPNIRYLCAVCVMCGIALQGRKEFDRLEDERKAARRPMLRIRKKTKQAGGKPTLSTC